MQPGDCLYLPRGVPHDAVGVDGAALHLTLGIKSPTWLDVLERVWSRAKENPALRASLPIGYTEDPDAFAAAMADVLATTAEWMTRLDPEALTRAEIERAEARAPDPVGRLRALVTAHMLEPDTRLCRASEVRWSVRLEGDRAILRAGSHALGFPARVVSALHHVMAADTVAGTDLGEHLDAEGAMVLVRRLHREGLLRRP